MSIVSLAEGLVADRILSDRDVDAILDAARERSKEKPLTQEEISGIMKAVRNATTTFSFKKTPAFLKFISIVLIVGGIVDCLASSITLGYLILFDRSILLEVLKAFTLSTNIIIVVSSLTSFLASALSVLVGVRVLRGHRGAASVLVLVGLSLNAVSATCEIMLFGVGLGVFVDNLLLAFAQAALSAYLNPSLAREQTLRNELRKLDNQTHYRLGTLGLADPGKGFIRLDFFNVFWTFIVASFLGLLVEIAFHMIVVDPGVYQDRAGMLFGPFSPIYGVGAVLMTIALNRFKECNLVIIFVVCTIIGGGFEFFVSWFMETAFGAVAWDYHGEFLGDFFGGRTCLKFASMFGVLGCVWIKIFLPALLKLINKIPLGLRYSGTIFCAALMLVNAFMTFQALDNWSERLAGNEPNTPVEQFYAETFDDEYMAKRFESMVVNPENSVRA